MASRGVERVTDLSWLERLHPRAKKGTRGGGKFISLGGGYHASKSWTDMHGSKVTRIHSEQAMPGARYQHTSTSAGSLDNFEHRVAIISASPRTGKHYVEMTHSADSEGIDDPASVHASHEAAVAAALAHHRRVMAERTVRQHKRG